MTDQITSGVSKGTIAFVAYLVLCFILVMIFYYFEMPWSEWFRENHSYQGSIALLSIMWISLLTAGIVSNLIVKSIFVSLWMIFGCGIASYQAVAPVEHTSVAVLVLLAIGLINRLRRYKRSHTSKGDN